MLWGALGLPVILGIGREVLAFADADEALLAGAFGQLGGIALGDAEFLGQVSRPFDAVADVLHKNGKHAGFPVGDPKAFAFRREMKLVGLRGLRAVTALGEPCDEARPGLAYHVNQL